MLLFSKIYEFYCLYGIEILLSGAAGAVRRFPTLSGAAGAARLSCATVRWSTPPLGLGIRLRDLKKPHFFGLYYPYIPYYGD